MLRLKVIWSARAALGTLWSLLTGAPPAACVVFVIFLAFHTVWLRYLFLFRLPTGCPKSSKPIASVTVITSVENTTFFLGREAMMATTRAGMASWRVHLFS